MRGLMIPAFSFAIWSMEWPSHFSWSKSIGVMTLTDDCTALVASSRPPMPVSSTTNFAARFLKMLQRQSCRDFKKCRMRIPTRELVREFR